MQHARGIARAFPAAVDIHVHIPRVAHAARHQCIRLPPHQRIRNVVVKVVPSAPSHWRSRSHRLRLRAHAPRAQRRRHHRPCPSRFLHLAPPQLRLFPPPRYQPPANIPAMHFLPRSLRCAALALFLGATSFLPVCAQTSAPGSASPGPNAIQPAARHHHRPDLRFARRQAHRLDRPRRNSCRPPWRVWTRASASPPLPRPTAPAPNPTPSGRPTPPPSPSSPIAPISAANPISISRISTAIRPGASPLSTAMSMRPPSRPTASASPSSMSKAPPVLPAPSPPWTRPPASSAKTTLRSSASPRSLRQFRFPRPSPPRPPSSPPPTFTSTNSIGLPIPRPSPTSPPTLPAKTTGGSPSSTRNSPLQCGLWQTHRASSPPPTSPAPSTACKSPFPAGRPTAKPSPSSAAS